MPYYPKRAYYEGSPELGYVSKGQIVEFVEKQAQEADKEQLFSLRDSKKTEQFGTLVFNRLLHASGINPYYYKDKDEATIDCYIGGDEVISGSTFEAGIKDKELGILVNLDYFDKLLNGGAWTEYQRTDISGKSGAAIKAYIQERKAFIGITTSRYANNQ